MKTKAFIGVLLVLSAFAYAETGAKSKFEVSIGGSFGGLFAGGQKDIIQDSVTPKPDGFLVATLNVQGAYFPLEYLGVEAGANVLGNITASSSEVSDSLGVYKFTTVYFGLNLRKYLSESNSSSVSLGAGVNYTTLKYHEDYKDLFSGFEFYAIDPKIGFYLKGAYNYYFSKNFFFSANVQFVNTKAYIDESDYDLDGSNVLLGAAIGFAL